MNTRMKSALAALLLSSLCACAGTQAPDLAADRAALASRAGPGAGLAANRDHGLAEFFAGRPAQAREALERALDQSIGQSIDRGQHRDARALLGLGLLHHDAGRAAEARALWTEALSAYDPRDPWAAPIAELAAHRLLALVNDAPGTKEEERAFAARLLSLWQRRAALPPEARQLLAATTGQLVRLKGDEAAGARIDEERGCPGAFYISGPRGHLPRLDLAAPFPPDDPARDPGRAGYTRISAPGCELTLDGAQGRPGVMHAVAYAQVESAAAYPLTVESGGETWALYVDGALRHREDLPRRRHHLSLQLDPGWHAITLKVSVPAGKVQVQLALEGARFFKGDPASAPVIRSMQAAQGQGQSQSQKTMATLRPLSPPPGPGRADRGAVPLLLGAVVRAQQAFLSGETDEGLRALQPALALAPSCPSLHILQANLLAEDRSRPQRIVRDRARRALGAALRLDPALQRVRLNLAAIELQEDRPERAQQILDAAPKNAQAGWQTALLRHRVLRARGWLREAEAALDRARALGPAACEPLLSLASLRREFHDARGALEAARALAACNPYSDRLVDELRGAGLLAEAEAELRRLLRLEPDDEEHRAALAEVLIAQGGQGGAQAGAQAGQAGEERLREAQGILAALAARFPRTASYRVKLAGALLDLKRRPEAEAALRAGLAAYPESQELHKALLSFGAAPLLSPYRVDGRAAIAAYKADPVASGREDAAAIVLDRTVTRVLPGGARLTLTHNIIHVLTKDGADKFGEVQIPEGAEVLTLRTVKADGGTREPEDIAEKDSVSAPDLEIGDYVEFEYIDRDPAPPAFPGGFAADRFYFASGDAPLFRTEYVLVAPADMALQLDLRGPPGDADTRPQARREGDLQVLVWARKKVPRLQPEPPQAEGLLAEWIPSVRPGAGLTPARWRDYLRDRLFTTLRENDELQKVAAREAPASLSPKERAARLCAFVRANIKQGGSLDEEATEILARREGQRVVLLMALLRAAGLPAELWLVRPVSAPRLAGPLPHLEAYSEPLLVLQKGQETIYLDPFYRHAPSGFVRPALRGGEALRLGMLGPGSQPPAALFGEVALPLAGSPGPDPIDSRRVQLSMSLHADGSGEVQVVEELRGWPAVEWREELERLPEDKVRQELEQRSLGFYFPGASLLDLRYGPLTEDQAPLTVRYRFRAPRLSRVRKGEAGPAELVLPAPYPALLGRRYVGVPQRQTVLQLNYVVPTELIADVTLPQEAAAARIQPRVELSDFGRFSQEVEVKERAVRLRARFAMPVQRVLPERYPDFVRYARAVDAAEAAAALVPLAAPGAGPAAK